MIPPYNLPQILFEQFCIGAVHPTKMLFIVLPSTLDTIGMTLYYFTGINTLVPLFKIWFVHNSVMQVSQFTEP